MDAELKTKWVTALRSGEYKQGKARLRTQGDEFCCLGVLCEILAPSRWTLMDEGSPHRYWQHGIGESFPDDVANEEAGLDVKEGEYLANMNDTGSSFAEIADYIDQNL